MKTNRKFVRRGWWCALAIGLLLCSAGCLEKRIFWSPDATRAVVIGDTGLYLCDADGKISGLLVPSAKQVAWFQDSKRLALTRLREVNDWATIAPSLRDGRAAIEAEADELARDVVARGKWSLLLRGSDDRKKLVEICARDRHGAELKAHLSADEWNGLAQTTVFVTDVLTATVDADTVKLGPVLHTHFGDITELRLDRNDRALAWTQAMVSNKDYGELMVRSLTEQAQAVVVAQHVAGYPDWDREGRSVVYVEATVEEGKSNEEVIVLGVVTRRRVLNDAGQVAVAEKPERLAGVLFGPLTHVRCLNDGRILFNAVEMSLPVAAADYGGEQREQLYALDPERHATVVRLTPRSHETDLPAELGFFEVSPDQSQVVFGGAENAVSVLTLATGEVAKIQSASGKDTYKGLPAWRRPGELTYVRRSEPKPGAGPARLVDIVLRTGEKERVLSQTWPDAVVADVIPK